MTQKAKTLQVTLLIDFQSLSLFVLLDEGSRELLLEGDILLLSDRNAVVCPDNSCFWKKSSNGLVEVPFTLSSVFCK